MTNNVIIKKLKTLKPNILGLSYRLTPSTLRPILQELNENYKELKDKPQKLFFAGTPEVVKVAKESNLFQEFFVGGESKHKIISILRNYFNSKMLSVNFNFSQITNNNISKLFLQLYVCNNNTNLDSLFFVF